MAKSVPFMIEIVTGLEAGSEKSTTARNLAGYKGYPLIVTDTLRFKDVNWIKRHIHLEFFLAEFSYVS